MLSFPRLIGSLMGNWLLVHSFIPNQDASLADCTSMYCTVVVVNLPLFSFSPAELMLKAKLKQPLEFASDIDVG